jgi:hypothetical protein
MAGAGLRLARTRGVSGSAAVCRLDGEGEQDQAARPERSGRTACSGRGGSDGRFCRGVVGGLFLLRLLGGKRPE